MQQLWLWRAATLVCAIGWAVSVSQSRHDAEPASATHQRDSRMRHAANSEQRAPTRSRHIEPARRIEDPHDADDSSRARTEEEWKQWAREEVDREHEARRQAHHEERLANMLDEAAAFADAEGLDEATGQALQDALVSFHDRLTELGPPKHGDEEHREAFHAALDDLNQSIDDTLTPEQHDAFDEWMRPPGGGPGGPGGPPPGRL